MALLLTLAFSGARAQQGEAPPAPFPLRILELGGPVDGPGVRDHLEFGIALGFNAVSLPGRAAGSWDAFSAPQGPFLLPSFVAFAEECRSRNLRLFVEIHPVLGSERPFVFSRAEDRRRLARFVRLLRRTPGATDVVLTFAGIPPRLHELADVLAFGTVAASAHIDLVNRLARGSGERFRLWFAPTYWAEEGQTGPEAAYGTLLGQRLATLPAGLGLLWSGPRSPAPAIGTSDVAAVRRRVAPRPLILQDRFPYNGGGQGLSLALVLGPLRHRDAGIADHVQGYLACPMRELGASRLSLLTVADFLAAPETYDADRSWERAQHRLAGDSEEARMALDTQTLEWGGWIGERNYHTTASDNPRAVAEGLRDPAYVASWTWTAKRYPERMKALESLADGPFREDLLEIMGRRLVIARAMPVVLELRARLRVGRRDTEVLIGQLARERQRVAASPTIRLSLDRFLDAAGVFPLPGVEKESEDQR